ncbi:MAG: B12-binding domain-containing radical SAM protein, partial [Nitrososphaerales archaeon]
MAKYVLISDTTLSNEYRDFPLLDFLPCVPTSLIPSPFYSYLKGDPPPPIKGRASRAAYPIRKVEAALCKENTEDEVVVPHEDYIENFIGRDTEVIGINTMDPFGIGPLTMSFPIFFGLENHPYVTKEFSALLARINRARKGTRAKVVVGGPGVWECIVLPEEMDRLRIDYAFQGEVEDVACTLFREIADGSFTNNVFFKGFQTFDHDFRKLWSGNDKFISRSRYS